MTESLSFLAYSHSKATGLTCRGSCYWAVLFLFLSTNWQTLFLVIVVLRYSLDTHIHDHYPSLALSIHCILVLNLDELFTQAISFISFFSDGQPTQRGHQQQCVCRHQASSRYCPQWNDTCISRTRHKRSVMSSEEAMWDQRAWSELDAQQQWCSHWWWRHPCWRRGQQRQSANSSNRGRLARMICLCFTQSLSK